MERCFETMNVSCSLSVSYPLILATNDVGRENKKQEGYRAILISDRAGFNIENSKQYREILYQEQKSQFVNEAHQ